MNIYVKAIFHYFIYKKAVWIWTVGHCLPIPGLNDTQQVASKGRVKGGRDFAVEGTAYPKSGRQDTPNVSKTACAQPCAGL